jgi:hypothetical protein
MSLTIVSRAQWGAKAPRNRIATTWGRRTEFVVHHSEGPTNATVRSIQDFHMGPQRKWADVAYNFLVRDDGTIYEGRGWLTVGAHATGHNTSGIGVCYIGMNAPTDAAKHSIRALYDYACGQAGHKLLMRGHGQLSQNSTDCPGSKLLAWVKAGMLDPKPTPSTPSTAPPFPGRLLVFEAGQPVMQGADVLAWQRQMRARGWTLTVDGSYTAESAAVCRRFQEDSTAHGWPLTVDGMCGGETWRATFERPVT